MLILTRYLQEKIVINDEITIIVLRLKPNKVRLGICAPKHITIRRGEGKILEKQGKRYVVDSYKK